MNYFVFSKFVDALLISWCFWSSVRQFYRVFFAPFGYCCQKTKWILMIRLCRYEETCSHDKIIVASIEFSGWIQVNHFASIWRFPSLKMLSQLNQWSRICEWKKNQKQCSGNISFTWFWFIEQINFCAFSSRSVAFGCRGIQITMKNYCRWSSAHFFSLTFCSFIFNSVFFCVCVVENKIEIQCSCICRRVSSRFLAFFLHRKSNRNTKCFGEMLFHLIGAVKPSHSCKPAWRRTTLLGFSSTVFFSSLFDFLDSSLWTSKNRETTSASAKAMKETKGKSANERTEKKISKIQ